MTDEQTNAPDTEGKEVDTSTEKPTETPETSEKPLAPDGENLSDYDKALALVKRREEATKAENEVLDRKEKLAANSMLGGTTGGHVDVKPKEETPKE